MSQAAPVHGPAPASPATRQVTNFQGLPDQILPQLQGVAAQDAIGDQQRKREGTRLGLFTGLGCAAIFASFFFLGLFPPLAVVGFIGGAVLVVLAVKTGRKKAQLDALDLDNDRLALVQQLIQSLTRDLRAGRPLALTLCHGEATEKGVKTNEEKQGNWFTGQVTVQEYEDDWLRLRGRFADGSVFRIEVTQETKRKSKPKRKYTKVTDRNRERVRVSLRVPAQRYPNLARINQHLQAQVLANHVGLQVCGIQASGNVIRIAARTWAYVDQRLRHGTRETGQQNKLIAGKVLAMLAFIYGALSHCGPDLPATGQEGPAPAAPSHIPPPVPGSPA